MLAGNVRRFLAGEQLAASFDGDTNCFIETGRGQALPNHLGKRAFQPLYWHGLLPGRDIPGISPAMPARGKNLLALADDPYR